MNGEINMDNYAQQRAMQEIDELYDGSSKISKYWSKFCDKYWDKYGSFWDKYCDKYGNFANYLKRQLIFTTIIMTPILLNLLSTRESEWLILITPIYYIS